MKFPEKIRSSDVRGFRPLSIGPRDQEDVIGGDTSISGTVALVSKFPRSSPDNPFRFHVFANSGSVIDRDLSRSVLENLQLLNAANRISLGAGVLANMGAFQAELNFIHPVKFLSADKPRYFELRFQLGM